MPKMPNGATVSCNLFTALTELDVSPNVFVAINEAKATYQVPFNTVIERSATRVSP
jgi:hypothetical protein